MALQIEKSGKHHEYILKADRESSAPTKFQLRQLTWEEMSEVGQAAALTVEQLAAIARITAASREEGRDLNSEEIEQVVKVMPADAESMHRMLQQHATAVRYGVVGINGLLDTDDQPLTMTAAELARRAPQTVLLELGTEIMRMSRYNEDAIKK